MANNLLFIVLVVAGVLLLTGGLTGNLAYRMPYYKTPTYISTTDTTAIAPQTTTTTTAQQLSLWEQKQETRITNLQTQVQTLSSASLNQYFSLLSNQAGINYKLDTIAEETGTGAYQEFGCNCICKEQFPGTAAWGKACVKACATGNIGGPIGSGSSVCQSVCTTYCGNGVVVAADCKAECRNPPV